MKSRLLALGIILFSWFVLSGDEAVEFAKGLMGQGFVGPFAYSALLAAGVVLAPLTVLPAITLAASLFGPLWTTLLSILGWSVGAILAFLVARHVGKPLLGRIVSLEEIALYEKKLPAGTEFWGVVLLRMLVPVDLLSYALGMLTAMPLRPYILATVIGVTPFSIVFSYGGAALASGSYLTLFGIALFAFLLFFIIVREYRKRYGTRR